MTLESIKALYRFCYAIDFAQFSRIVRPTRPLWEESLLERHWQVFTQDPLRFLATYPSGGAIVKAFLEGSVGVPVD